jgi:hypothetical protein
MNIFLNGLNIYIVDYDVIIKINKFAKKCNFLSL